MRFLKPRPPEELVSIYQAADVVAMPSANESFGLVALEAQATGTPVVATRIGGLQAAVAEGKSGLLVDGQDPQAWADALGQLLSDDDQRIAMAEYAPQHRLLQLGEYGQAAGGAIPEPPMMPEEGPAERPRGQRELILGPSAVRLRG